MKNLRLLYKSASFFVCFLLLHGLARHGNTAALGEGDELAVAVSLQREPALLLLAQVLLQLLQALSGGWADGLLRKAL